MDTKNNKNNGSGIMNTMGIAKAATDMNAMNVRTEASMKVMKLAMDTVEQEGEGLMKIIDSMLTGLGQKFDISA